jgi:hypothetical protein
MPLGNVCYGQGGNTGNTKFAKPGIAITVDQMDYSREEMIDKLKEFDLSRGLGGRSRNGPSNWIY